MAPAGRTVTLLGVPLRTGSLMPGSENDAQAYRDAGVVDRLRAAGCAVVDGGDVAIPSYLPHHSIPPIRSWPGPRIAWDCVGERLAPLLREPGQLPLLLGCDCSIVVGTARALAAVAPAGVHVLYVDGDFDDAPPDGGRCQSAAAMAVWLLTRGGPFRAEPPLAPGRVTVVGWNLPSATPADAVPSVSLADIRREGPRAAARRALAGVAPDAAVLVHFDIDVLRQAEMPAAYFPRAEGLTLAEVSELLDEILHDPRLRLVEVAEFAALRDRDQQAARAIIDVLARGLGPAR
jgi:arginase